MNEEQSQRFWDHVGPAIGLGALAGAIAGLLVGVAFTSWWTMFLDQGSTQEALSQREVSEAIQELVKEEAATIEVVRRVSGAVVSVVARKPIDEAVREGSSVIILNGEPLGGAPDDSDGDGLVDVGSGTAFFVTSEGLLLTNRHVVNDEDARYFVMTAEGGEFEVEIVARDTLYDVAVLRAPEGEVPEGGFSTLGFSADEAVVGQTVIAVGNALGEFSGSVTKGIVSGTDREIVAGSRFGSELIEEAIQTDAAINPGNSGGPLINLNGEVIGINTAVSGRGSGLGFAIPIEVGRRAIEDVIEFGRIVRPWLGIRYVMLNNERAETYGLPKLQRGAYILPKEETDVLGVLPDSPAARAGLREGDVIVGLDGRVLTEDDNFATLLNDYEPGETIELEVLRDGTVIPSVSVTLGEFDYDAVQ